VVGHYHHNYLLAAERVADHDPSLLSHGAPRHRLWKIRAAQVIVASGALERPIAFANNDRPGIMMASAVRALVERYATAPGMNGVIFTNNDDAYLTALKLNEAGVGVARIIDVRANASSELVEAARKAGLQVQTGAAIAGVETSSGGKNISAIKVAPYAKGRGRVVNEEKVACDFVAVSGGFNPVVHLWCHNAGKLKFDDTIHSFRPDRHGDPMLVVGAANGTFDLAGCLEEGYAAGEAAAKAIGGKAGKLSKAAASGGAAGTVEAIWFAPATGKYNEGNKHFIDFQNDVTAADLELAQREGYESVEHTKRYTTLGMATDQGKTSNINGLGVISDATGRKFRDRHNHVPPALYALIRSVPLPAARRVSCSCRYAGPRFMTGTWPERRNLGAGRPMAARLLLPLRRRKQEGRDQPRDSRGAQQGRSAGRLDPWQDRDQGTRCRQVARPGLHQHVLNT
jgi:sarcosine oxidase subunit alpha